MSGPRSPAPKRFPKRTVAIAVAAVIVGVSAWQAVRLHRYLWIACGYAAKVAGSCVFVGGRALESVRGEELAAFGALDVEVDVERGIARASAFGLVSREAVHRPGLGCALVDGAPERPGAELLPPLECADPAAPWPVGESVVLPVNGSGGALEAALDFAFEEPDPADWRRTRSVVVVHGGHIVAERHAEGFSPHVPQHGWSMSKSVINALIGVLVQRGAVDVHAAAPVAAWQQAGDGRSLITIEHLLHMTSGLEFTEDYEDPYSDALAMLFGETDMFAYAADRALVAPPGAVWHYSSGSSLVLSGIVRSVVGEALHPTFARTALFEPLGMTSAVFETDASGTLVGSSMCWASARDWARFGLLYLRDGVWNGERLLPEGWVEYTRAPATAAPEGRYGAHWWSNAGDAAGVRRWPALPTDLFYASGFQGQYVVVVPSADCVVVRLGQSRTSATFPLEEFLERVLAALQ